MVSDISKIRNSMSATMSLDWGVRYFSGRAWHAPDRLLNYIGECLSGLRRFTGKSHITVAEHSCIVAGTVSAAGGGREIIRYALLHDATEAFMSDVPRPMKKLMPEYSELEDIVLQEVYADLGHGLPAYHIRDAVKAADDIACSDELRRINQTKSFALPPIIARKQWWRAYNDNERRRMSNPFSASRKTPPVRITDINTSKNSQHGKTTN